MIFTEFLLAHAKRFIIVTFVKSKPYMHPWIDETCRRLLQEKHDAVGSPSFSFARNRCTAGFREAQSRFLISTKLKLKTSNAKDWCKLSRELLRKSSGIQNILPLKVSGGWAKDPEAKASALSATFASKYRLPEFQTNEYTDIDLPQAMLRQFIRTRRRDVLKIL